MEIDGVKIEYLGHSGFVITCKDGKRVAIDPFSVSQSVGKVDMILITHSHYDHCSIKDIGKLKKEGTIIVTPTDSQSKVTKIDNIRMEIVEIGDAFEFGRIKIEAVPAYNIGKDFHAKREGWIGYLVKIENIIIYHAGDSDRIPEMEKLTGYGKQGNHFITLLPVSGKYVMNASEAAAVAELLKPEVAIPMHYGSGVAGTLKDALEFVDLCKDRGIHAEFLEKI